MIMKAAIKILALQDYINLRSVNFRRCNNKREVNAKQTKKYD